MDDRADQLSWVKVFRLLTEFRILGKAASKSTELDRL